jgi:hypothetical protein
VPHSGVGLGCGTGGRGHGMCGGEADGGRDRQTWTVVEDAWPTPGVPWARGCERHAENSKCVGCTMQDRTSYGPKAWPASVCTHALAATSVGRAHAQQPRSTRPQWVVVVERGAGLSIWARALPLLVWEAGAFIVRDAAGPMMTLQALDVAAAACVCRRAMGWW